MTRKSTLEKQHHSYRRYRALARSLSARVFLTADGRLLLVGGEPDFSRLLACLSHRRKVPQIVEAPTPPELGFPAFCDGELSQHGLQARSHALTKWSRALDSESRDRWPNRHRARQIFRERDEIATLQRRLAELLDVSRRLSHGLLSEETPYLLDSVDQLSLTQSLSEFERDRRLPALARWMARIVMWTSGTTALHRYLHSLTPLLRQDSDWTRIEQIRKFQRQLRIWKQRCGEEDHRHIHSELRQTIKKFPPRVISEAQIGSRLRGRSVPEHCDLLVQQCQEMLAKLDDIPTCHLPACTAALVTCDLAQTVLPARVIRECLNEGELDTLKRWVTSLHDVSSKPAYEDLLSILDQFKELPGPCENDAVRIMLATGATLEEIQWVQQLGLLYWFDDEFPDARWLLSFFQRIRHAGIKLDEPQLTKVLEAIEEKRDAAVLNQWLRWLGSLSRSTLTPRTGKLITKGLLDLIVPGFSKLACHSRLQSWANPPTRVRYPIEPAAAKYPALHDWLRKICFYQELAGGKPGMPKSVRKQLDTLNRQARERAFLQQAVATGRVSQTQMARLQYLDAATTTSGKVSQTRLIRAAEEAFLVVAMDALRVILREAAEDLWRNHVGHPLPEGSPARLVSFAGWVRAMEDSQRRMLREVFRAWSLHGPAYQIYLTANHRWLEQADANGLNLENWLRPQPAVVVVAGNSVRISVAHDPMEVFLMGTYFGTCLSQGGCNQMSVLANAHDANKQVVYMHNSQGKVQCRQLVAISDQFQLLGYRCYTGMRHDNEDLHDNYIAAMADYCGRWARQCGIPLAQTGEPVEIADHFWYDDGVCPWHQAAKSAWEAQVPRASEPLQPGPSVRIAEPVLA